MYDIQGRNIEIVLEGFSNDPVVTILKHSETLSARIQINNELELWLDTSIYCGDTFVQDCPAIETVKTWVKNLIVVE